jgi:hypothetical protein
MCLQYALQDKEFQTMDYLVFNAHHIPEHRIRTLFVLLMAVFQMSLFNPMVLALNASQVITA